MSFGTEWTAASPPPHGNWGETPPVVYRRPYDYTVLGASDDYPPQAVEKAPTGAGVGAMSNREGAAARADQAPGFELVTHLI